MILALVVVFVFLYISTTRRINELSYEDKINELSRRVRDLADIVDERATAERDRSVYLASHIDIIQGFQTRDYQRIESFVRSIKEQNETIENIVVLNNRDQIVASGLSIEGLDLDVATDDENLPEEDVEAIEVAEEPQAEQSAAAPAEDEGLVGNPEDLPIISPVSGHSGVVYSTDVFVNGRRAGLVTTVFDLTIYSEQRIVNKTFGREGYPFLIDYRGNVIAHPDQTMLMNEEMRSRPAIQHIIRSGEPMGIYETKDSYLSYQRLENLSWYAIGTISKRDLLSVSQATGIVLLVVSGISIVALLGITMILVSLMLISRISQLNDSMETAAKGNLKIRARSKSQDELGSIAATTNHMLEQFANFLSGVKSSSVEMKSIGASVKNDSGEVMRSMANMQDEMNNVRQSVELQAEQAGASVEAVEKLSELIKSLTGEIESQSYSISDSTSAVEEMTSGIQSISSTMRNSAEEIAQMRSFAEQGRATVENFIKVVDEIGAESQKLNEANVLIANLSGQTNLLAMNAAIEAAHAGDSGRGFAVVADEIRKLAESSSEQSKVVKGNIKIIRESINGAIAYARETRDGIQEIDTSTEKVSRIFSEMKYATEELDTGSKQILQGIEQMRDITNSVISSSSEIAEGTWSLRDVFFTFRDGSQKIQNVASQIADTMGNVSNAMGKLSTQSETAAHQSQNLDELLDQYDY